MPASVYKLVFHDPSLEKLTPSKLQIGTYTNDTVKIVGTCKLYLVHQDTKKLVETIFYVVINDGAVLLSCKSILALDLIQHWSRLDYLPPRASLMTSTQDHPKKDQHKYIVPRSCPLKARLKWKQAQHPVYKILCKHQQSSSIGHTR